MWEIIYIHAGIFFVLESITVKIPGHGTGGLDTHQSNAGHLGQLVDFRLNGEKERGQISDPPLI